VTGLRRRRLPAILVEQVVQPQAERVDVGTQPVDVDLGVPQFIRRLLAGRQQQDQRSDKFVVGGDAGSFLGDGAVPDSRSGACSISA